MRPHIASLASHRRRRRVFAAGFRPADFRRRQRAYLLTLPTVDFVSQVAHDMQRAD